MSDAYQWSAPAPTATTVLRASTPRRRGRALFAAGAAAGGVALAAAGAWALVGLLGGGSHAADHLPGTAVLAAVVDLDPSAGQKVAALQFAHRFPSTGRLDWGSTENDPRRWLYEQAIGHDRTAPPWAQVQPWLGRRAGLALLPPSGSDTQPVVVLALQVSDVEAATATLTRSTSTGHGPHVAADGDGWVIVSDTQAHADAAVAQIGRRPLSGSATFSADLSALGEAGIADLWFDGQSVSELAPALAASGGVGLPALPTTTKAHGVVALRFDGPALELAGAVHDLDPAPTVRPVEVLAPPGAAAAVSVSGLGEQLATTWATLVRSGGPQADRLVAGLRSGSGLQLPQDLVALGGTQFTLSVAAAGGVPDPTVRVVTAGDVAGPLQRLTRAVRSHGGPALAVRRTSDGYVLATTESGLASMAGSGGLADDPRFTAAVPHAAAANAVAYVDIEQVVSTFGTSLSEADRATLEPLDALGLSSRSDGAGGSAFTLRLTTR